MKTSGSLRGLCSDGSNLLLLPDTLENCLCSLRLGQHIVEGTVWWVPGRGGVPGRGLGSAPVIGGKLIPLVTSHGILITSLGLQFPYL